MIKIKQMIYIFLKNAEREIPLKNIYIFFFFMEK